MSDPRLNLQDWLPGMIGPLEVQVNGTPYAAQTFVWNFTGAVTVSFDPTYVDPQTPLNDDGTQTPIGRAVFNFGGGGTGTAPANTGFATVTEGAFDTNATANLQYVGGKLQTKTNIQFVSGSEIGDLSWTPTNARTITLPDATGTVVLKDTTDTLTNKTFDVAANTLIATSQAAGDLLLNDGTKFNRLPKGADGTFLGVAGGAVGWQSLSQPTVVQGTTPDNTQYTIASWSIVDNAITVAIGDLEAISTGGANYGNWLRRRRFKSVSGTVTAGTVQNVLTDNTDMTNGDYTIDNSTTTGRHRFTGLYGTTYYSLTYSRNERVMV